MRCPAVDGRRFDMEEHGRRAAGAKRRRGRRRLRDSSARTRRRAGYGDQSGTGGLAGRRSRSAVHRDQDLVVEGHTLGVERDVRPRRARPDSAGRTRADVPALLDVRTRDARLDDQRARAAAAIRWRQRTSSPELNIPVRQPPWRCDGTPRPDPARHTRARPASSLVRRPDQDAAACTETTIVRMDTDFGAERRPAARSP